MAVIDPVGLFRGERISACSDRARLIWPYLFAASNGYARLELSVSSVISEIFGNFRNPPEAGEIVSIIEEYATNYLLILYEVSGVWWVQFDTSEKYLKRRKTAKDEESPAPPPELLERFRNGYLDWKSSKSLYHEQFRKFSETFETFPSGIGIGIGSGIGRGKDLNTLQRAAAESPDRPGDREKKRNTDKTSQNEPASPKPATPMPEQEKSSPETGATLATHIKIHGTGKEKHPQAIDPRHTPFKAQILEFWKQLNGTECPWDGIEGKSLNSFLAKNPSIDMAGFTSLLSCRSQSDINPSAMPHMFLTKLRQYESGPLDAFGRPKKKARMY